MVDTPSSWVVRWSGYITRGPVLDVACGSGRHARHFAQRGLEVVAVDREEQALDGNISFVRANLEDGSPWPFGERRDRKSTRLNSSHSQISYAVFCLKKKKD